jgi:mono/diheme cytochrome c family protein
MGSHHPAEYFAESILYPNRVIVMGPGYTGPDNLSKMPSYAETMTLKQLVDVVAYLRSLTDGDMGHGGHQMGGSSKEAPMKMK